MAGLDRNYVTEAERGRANPTLSTIGKLAEALGVEDSAPIRTARRELHQPEIPKRSVLVLQTSPLSGSVRRRSVAIQT